LEESGELVPALSPEAPGPGENLTIRVSSPDVSLAGFLILWRENGVLKKEGVGETLYETKTGPAGSVLNISVSARRANEFLSKEISVRPAEASLVWEADVYTPMFYQGKGLASHQSEVRFVALVDMFDNSGKKASPQNIFYEWSVGNKVDKGRSGLGKDTFRLRGEIVSRSKDVLLLASLPNTNIKARAGVLLDFVEPELLVYKENPLSGLRESEVARSVPIEEGEATFVAEPYFFSRDIFNSGRLAFDWRVGGRKIENLKTSNKITIGGENKGSSAVSVSVLNPVSFLQKAFASFSVVLR